MHDVDCQPRPDFTPDIRALAQRIVAANLNHPALTTITSIDCLVGWAHVWGEHLQSEILGELAERAAMIHRFEQREAENKPAKPPEPECDISPDGVAAPFVAAFTRLARRFATFVASEAPHGLRSKFWRAGEHAAHDAYWRGVFEAFPVQHGQGGHQVKPDPALDASRTEPVF